MDIYIPGAPIPTPPASTNKIAEAPAKTLKPARHNGIVLSLIFVVALVVGIVYFMPQVLGILFGRDSAKQDYSDLQLGQKAVPYDENGFFDLNQIIEGVVYEPSPGYFQSLSVYPITSSLDQALAGSVVSKNQQALSMFDAAATKKSFQAPAYSDPGKLSVETQDYPVDFWVQAAKVKALQSILLSVKNQPEAAATATLSIIKLGNNVQNSQGTLSEYLAGLQIKNIGYEALLAVLSTPGFSSKDIRDYISETYGYVDNYTGLKNAFLAEYYKGVNTIDLISSKKSADIFGDPKAANNPKHNIADKANNNFYFKPNETKALFADYVHQQLKDSDQLCGDSDIFATKSYAAVTQNEIFGMFTSNVVGKYLFQSQALSFGSLQKARCQQDMLAQVVAAMLGLKAYRIDYKVLPDKLTDLTPNYLINIPSDVYDSNVLKFSKGKQLIYSVGLSGKDVGGSTGTDWTKMQNPTFRVNF